MFVNQLKESLNMQRSRQHIYATKYVSSKEPPVGFSDLQKAIYDTAKTMSSWGKRLPLRWIHLETALDVERDAGSNILTFDLVCKLAKESSLSTKSDNKEIILFLSYQHECGHVIFFKDLSNYIILKPRWLIDAFKCLVSNQLNDDLLYSQDWADFEETGKLTDTLISDLFGKVPELKLMVYKEHLLPVLEKFDIIVKLKNKDRTSYYMPCMMNSLQFDTICNKYDLESYNRTSWLLLEFEFLPPAFFNHVLVNYIRKFPISSVNGKASLYRRIGVFDLEKQCCKKLVICEDKNLIAFQIWIYKDKLDKPVQFHDFPQDLTNMVDMLSKRYQICCKYKVKMKCSISDYRKAESRFEYKDLQGDTKYLCDEHGCTHECLDVYKYWFSDKVDVSYTCNY